MLYNAGKIPRTTELKMPTGVIRYTYKDYAGQSSAVEFLIPEVTSSNIANTISKADSVQSALDDLTLGQLNRRAITMQVLEPSSASASNALAARELKWLVVYTDNTTGKAYSIEIPCPKLTGNLTPGTEFANLSSGNWSDFISAFQGFAVSPDGNPVTVQKAKKVGRNI
jgi:hypothetical protein